MKVVQNSLILWGGNMKYLVLLYSVLLFINFNTSHAYQAEKLAGDCTLDGKYCAYFSPDDIPVEIVKRYLNSAKRVIRIATYNMNVEDFQFIIQRKLNQGVKVEFLVDYKLSFSSNRVWNAVWNHQNLIKYRVPVLRGGNPQMHNKWIFIDDHTLLMGSANWTYNGLVANYENVMAVREPKVVAQFLDEYNELKETGKIACRLFARGNCGTGYAKYDQGFHHYATTGMVHGSVINPINAKCSNLSKKNFGFLNEGNQPAFPGITNCFRDPRYANLISQVSSKEKFVDGDIVSKYAKVIDKKVKQDGYVQSYFSPEDNVQRVILKELYSTINDPQNSFAYISVNFITNRYIAETLVKMYRAGVRMKLFFDRGRYLDPNFQHVVGILNEIGFTYGDQHGKHNLISIFNNTLTGPYACNHNKMAVIGTPQGGVRLLNGSANWSHGAMRKNDENLVVVYDPMISSIYLKEILSELFVYRYGQNLSAPGFQEDVYYLGKRVPCFNAVMGLTKSCTVKGRLWKPRAKSSIVLSVENVPANPATEVVYAWVANLNNGAGGAIRLYTDKTFAGRWMNAVPAYLNQDTRFKFMILPKGVSPYAKGLHSARWEYGGAGNDRVMHSSSLSVQRVEKVYRWGQR
jgi:phosphatidylserine/phosphatidylglycerophosphate/cardiolipin synthase-like enzyme